MSSGFISEHALEEKRKARQEEWDKVRKPTDPEQAPEEPVETRSLFEQLNANRMKEQEEFEESRKFKNQIRGIDDDEAEFLEKVDDVRCRLEREKHLQERKELEEYRKSQAEFREKELEDRLKAANPPPLARSSSGGSKSSSTQSKLLMGAVKRPQSKDSTDESESKAAKVSKTDDANPVLGALAGIGDDYESSSDNDSS